MNEETPFYTKELQEMLKKLEAIPATDRGINFDNRGRRKVLTVYDDTASALMYVLDNVHGISSSLRYILQIREWYERTSVLIVANDESEEIIRKMKDEKLAVPLMVINHEPESHRINELLEANNRYLEDARSARRELAELKKEKHRHGN